MFYVFEYDGIRMAIYANDLESAKTHLRENMPNFLKKKYKYIGARNIESNAKILASTKEFNQLH